MTKKILLPLIALIAACSAHAITYQITYFGTLSEVSAPVEDPILEDFGFFDFTIFVNSDTPVDETNIMSQSLWNGVLIFLYTVDGEPEYGFNGGPFEVGFPLTVSRFTGGSSPENNMRGWDPAATIVSLSEFTMIASREGYEPYAFEGTVTGAYTTVPDSVSSAASLCGAMILLVSISLRKRSNLCNA